MSRSSRTGTACLSPNRTAPARLRSSSTSTRCRGHSATPRRDRWSPRERHRAAAAGRGGQADPLEGSGGLGAVLPPLRRVARPAAALLRREPVRASHPGDRCGRGTGSPRRARSSWSTTRDCPTTKPHPVQRLLRLDGRGASIGQLPAGLRRGRRQAGGAGPGHRQESVRHRRGSPTRPRAAERRLAEPEARGGLGARDSASGTSRVRQAWPGAARLKVANITQLTGTMGTYPPDGFERFYEWLDPRTLAGRGALPDRPRPGDAASDLSAAGSCCRCSGPRCAPAGGPAGRGGRPGGGDRLLHRHRDARHAGRHGEASRLDRAAHPGGGRPTALE